MRVDTRRRMVLVGIVVALVAIAGGIVVFTRNGTKDKPRIAVAGTSTSDGVNGTTSSSIAAPGHASMRITIDRTTAPGDGSPIPGHAVIDNETGHVIAVPSGNCIGWLAVGLSNAQIHYEYSTPAIACAPFEIPTGESRYPFTVSTQYSSCAMSGGSAEPPVPACVGPDRTETPPLPPGAYEAKVFGPPASIELPPATTVTLTPARSG